MTNGNGVIEMKINGWLRTLVIGVATIVLGAMIVGGGTLIAGNKDRSVDNEKKIEIEAQKNCAQDEKINLIEKYQNKKSKDIDDKLAKLDEKLDKLIDYQLQKRK